MNVTTLEYGTDKKYSGWQNQWALQTSEHADHQEAGFSRSSAVDYLPVPKPEHQAAKILLPELCASTIRF